MSVTLGHKSALLACRATVVLYPNSCRSLYNGVSSSNHHLRYNRLITSTPLRQLHAETQRCVERPVSHRMSCWGVKREGGRGGGGVEALELFDDVATPYIDDPNQVLVKVHAASVNPLDVEMLGGYGNNVLHLMRRLEAATNCSSSLQSCASAATGDQQHIFVGGRDFAGVVLGCGHAVESIKPGQRVMGVVSPQKTMGTHAQYIVVHQNNVVPCPSSYSSVECASVPYAALTAYSAAVLSGCLGNVSYLANKRVMVAGAAGGVGALLVQMLNAWGSQVVGVCSSSSFDLLSSLGVLELYDYNDKDAIAAITAEQSFDLIIDASGSHELQYLEALRNHGNANYVTLSSPLLRNTDEHGLLFGAAKSAFELLQQNRTSREKGRLVRWGYYTPSSSALAQIAHMMQRGQMKPVLDKVLSYSETRAAYEHMQQGRHLGKTVIDMKL